MANTTTISGKQILITGLDADWLWATAIGSTACYLRSVTFIPSAANDRFILHDGGIDAAELFDTGIVSGTDARTKYFADRGHRCIPTIDISDCTLGTAANCKVILEVA